MLTNKSSRSNRTLLYLTVIASAIIICCYLLEAKLHSAPFLFQDPEVRLPLLKRKTNATTTKAKQSLVITGPLEKSFITLVANYVHNGSNQLPRTDCQPLQRVVYTKTYKTGSTTLATILERYAYLRNLDLALPPLEGNHVLADYCLFQASMTIKIKNRRKTDFNILVHHVRYNREQMDIAVPHAKYISIIRHPVAQLESFFGYFEVAWRLHINTSNPFETFMSNVEEFYAKRNYLQWQRTRNGQLYDLGFDHRYDENLPKIKEKIKELAAEIDLMMINEYYDESLILLRKLMCWEYEDILYISKTIRSKSHRFPMTEEIEQRIRSWNAGDIMLYDHFNQTFWKKVQEYGNNFSQDLAHFRALQQNVKDQCIKKNATNKEDQREDKFVLKPNASTFCVDLLRGDIPYTRLLKETMIKRYQRR
ncbi:galactosylceramide sulfotransferase-like [Diadema antillarum]|uniref:galactosylceramide sulfotransferase-like n=1 Tax=Diadema antillarum TaxID=105358 RepID=UPI003A8A36DB